MLDLKEIELMQLVIQQAYYSQGSSEMLKWDIDVGIESNIFNHVWKATESFSGNVKFCYLNFWAEKFKNASKNDPLNFLILVQDEDYRLEFLRISGIINDYYVTARVVSDYTNDEPFVFHLSNKGWSNK